MNPSTCQNLSISLEIWRIWNMINYPSSKPHQYSCTPEYCNSIAFKASNGWRYFLWAWLQQNAIVFQNHWNSIGFKASHRGEHVFVEPGCGHTHTFSESLKFHLFLSVTSRDLSLGLAAHAIVFRINEMSLVFKAWFSRQQTPGMKFQLTCTHFESLLEPL